MCPVEKGTSTSLMGPENLRVAALLCSKVGVAAVWTSVAFLTLLYMEVVHSDYTHALGLPPIPTNKPSSPHIYLYSSVFLFIFRHLVQCVLLKFILLSRCSPNSSQMYHQLPPPQLRVPFFSLATH